MDIIKILFPVLFCFKEELDELEIISNNNFNLAKELEDKPPMSAKQIKEYCANRTANTTY